MRGSSQAWTRGTSRGRSGSCRVERKEIRESGVGTAGAQENGHLVVVGEGQ